MRKFGLSLIAAFGLIAGPIEAVANCKFGGQEVACETSNGHYRIKTPSGAGPHPTVVYLYGSLGNSAQKISERGFVQAFVERGYAVIVPAALDIRYRDRVGSGWFLRNERGHKKRNDTKFVEEVLDDAEVRHRIDRSRVLIAGMSRGGFLAWEIACHNPRLAAAYAPIASGYLGKMPQQCAGPVRLMHTHGRTDPIVPLSPDNPWSSGGARMQQLDSALERIAGTGGCHTQKNVAKFREYSRSGWSDCISNASVDLLVHNGGHDIPLSWYSTVVDWFEKGIRPPSSNVEARPVQAGTPTFKGVGEGTPRFKGVGSSSGSRFKKAKVPTQ
ncbi:MAG: PHB depolymerase family esterase [Pseudomonadota bacterium]